MSDLASLQRWMTGELRKRRSLVHDPATRDAAEKHFTGNDRVSPVEQLEIYREQFWLRHTSALVEDFPGLGGIRGQADWERLVEEYLEAVAPTSFSLRDLGDRLPELVANAAWLPHRELCRDMARLEWSYIEIFDAADAPALDPERLAAIPEAAWETARMILGPALRLLAVDYPVADLRRELKRASGPVAIPDASPKKLALYRVGGDLYDKELADAPFAMLEALAAGETLVAAAERVIELYPEEAEGIETCVGEWFADWGHLGWIIDVRLA
jgi:hypothetical protein